MLKINHTAEFKVCFTIVTVWKSINENDVASQVYHTVVPLLPQAWLTSGITTGNQSWTGRSKINNSSTCRYLTSLSINEVLKQWRAGHGLSVGILLNALTENLPPSFEVSVPDRWAKTNYTCHACTRAFLLAWLCHCNYIMPTVAFAVFGCLREPCAPLYHFLACSVSGSVRRLRFKAPFQLPGLAALWAQLINHPPICSLNRSGPATIAPALGC